MTLTNFIEMKESKLLLENNYELEKTNYDQRTKMKYESENDDVIEIAFDYLLKTYIAYLNPELNIRVRPNLEEKMSLIPVKYKSEAVVLSYLIDNLEEKYKDAKKISDYQITLYLQIAHYDIAFNSESFIYFPDELSKVDRGDIFILRGMIDQLNKDDWTGLK